MYIKLVCACFVKMTCRTTLYYRIGSQQYKRSHKNGFSKRDIHMINRHIITRWQHRVDVHTSTYAYIHIITHSLFDTISKKKIFSCTYKQNISLSSTRCDVSYFSTCCRWNRLITVLTHWWVGFLLKQFSRVSLVQHVHMRSVVV